MPAKKLTPAPPTVDTRNLGLHRPGAHGADAIGAVVLQHACAVWRKRRDTGACAISALLHACSTLGREPRQLQRRASLSSQVGAGGWVSPQPHLEDGTAAGAHAHLGPRWHRLLGAA